MLKAQTGQCCLADQDIINKVLAKRLKNGWELDSNSNFEKYLDRKKTESRVIVMDVEGHQGREITACQIFATDTDPTE